MHAEFLDSSLKEKRHCYRRQQCRCLVGSSWIFDNNIHTPAACKERLVIQFLNTQNVSVAEIQRQISEEYNKKIMRDSIARRWVWQIIKGGTVCFMSNAVGDNLSIPGEN